jgi:hypothetical protein
MAKRENAGDQQKGRRDRDRNYCPAVPRRVGSLLRLERRILKAGVALVAVFRRRFIDRLALLAELEVQARAALQAELRAGGVCMLASQAQLY